MAGPPSLDEVSRQLEGDDAHLITLKFLTLFGERCGRLLETGEDGWATLIWFQASLFAWDRKTYPQAEFVVFLDGTSHRLLAQLSARRPQGTLVLKTSDPRAQKQWEAVEGLTPIRRFLWYTADGPLDAEGLGVREVLHAEPELDRLMRENGYTQPELDDFRARGARWYVVEEDGRIQSFCFVYPNYGPVWEVGSVKTVGVLRRGFAARVVRAAVNSLVSRGHRVRYHVESENLASRALAESLGLVLHIEARHYLTPPSF